MNQLGTMYATKRRRRNAKSLKPQPKDSMTKSNPSKRHRERLNSELDTLAALLPFEQSILSKLDKLSILRLSVSYLRTKSYFQVAVQNALNGRKDSHSGKARDILYQEHLLEGDQILQALNGFVLILNCEGEVFFSSHTVENYLGFHQSDIVHQSVYELVHSEDREELQRQLMWNSHLPSDKSTLRIADVIQPENSHYLERSFTVRFRCLLDNTSGFLRLDIRGRVKVLHGQNRKTEEPPLALFAVCSPFGPPSLLDMPQKDVMFKSKHKLDLSIVSMDQRGKALLGYTDVDVANKSGYDLVHYDDIAYVAQAHQELLKTGASGLIAYRLVCKDKKWQWLQTSTRMLYKNSKPDFIICTHRPLVEEEGRDLLGKRTMDFKIGFLDTAVNVTERACLLSDGENTNRQSSPASNNVCISGGNTTLSRRYKSPQIRDVIGSTVSYRNKRTKISNNNNNGNTNVMNSIGDHVTTNGVANHSHHFGVDETNGSVNSYNTVYGGYPSENGGIGSYAAAFQPNFYPTIENPRFLTTAENFLHYRHHLSSYYPDYSAHTAPYTGNGLLDVTPAAVAPRSCFSTPGYSDGAQMAKEERLYPCQLEASKYNRTNECSSSKLVQTMSGKCEDYPANITTALDLPGRDGFFSAMLPAFDVKEVKLGDHQPMCASNLHGNDRPEERAKQMKMVGEEGLCDSDKADKSDPEGTNGLLQSNDARDTVLMWGNALDRDDYLNASCTKAVKVDSSNDPNIVNIRIVGGPATLPDTLNHCSSPPNATCNSNNSNNNNTCSSPSSSSSPTSVHHPVVISSSSPSSADSAATSSINVTSDGKLAFCTDSPIYSSTTISSELPLQTVGQQQDSNRISRRVLERQTGGNPLLSITEVTNTLLGHQN